MPAFVVVELGGGVERSDRRGDLVDYWLPRGKRSVKWGVKLGWPSRNWNLRMTG